MGGSKTISSFAKSDTYADLESDMRDKVLGKQKELEKLLWKADQEDIGAEEISLLKKRLMETENQMSRILKAMDAIQKTVSPDCYEYSQDDLKNQDFFQKDDLKNQDFFQNEIVLEKEKLCTGLTSNNKAPHEMVNLRRRNNISQED